MASDLPETFSTSHALAKALASYMDDAAAIRAAVIERFKQAPDLYKIRKMRERHLRKPQPEKPFKAYEGYYPADASKSAEETSKRFLAALDRERAISADPARSMGALDSPSLRKLEIVNAAWEREIDAARKLHGEDGR